MIFSPFSHALPTKVNQAALLGVLLLFVLVLLSACGGNDETPAAVAATNTPSPAAIVASNSDSTPQPSAATPAVVAPPTQDVIVPPPVIANPGPAATYAPADRDNLYKAAPEMQIDPAKFYYATFKTNRGDIKVQLFADRAPNAVNNFVYLARQGFYDNTTFHRVLDGFMAQGGDPTGFSGSTARMNNLDVVFITERCVFTLTDEGVELKEIAPGVDLEKDILAYMDFKPIVKNLKMMDERIFRLPPMDLKSDLLSKPISERLKYDPATNIFFVNFEGLQIRSMEDIEEIRAQTEAILEPLGRKVDAIVNYDNFSILPELVDAYAEAVKYVVSRFYENVTRYTTSAFLRMKLGEGLKARGFASHVYESREEARKGLKPSN